ncbi:sugar ABC transporter permease [Proteinivorax tanatarense]|uniref:Sugar ABC transporter permease n=1 Tax=Proteinivorax tanatarense TaxID=1260629 RepID=A0AAU7VJL1_9FIRM
MWRLKRTAKNIKKNRVWLLMTLPGLIWLIVLKYIPMFGQILAFKDFKFHPDGFLASIYHSEWVGLDNFRFLFGSRDAWVITRNTVLYNLVFIVLGLVLAVGFAIVLSEIANKRLTKVYQTGMLFPHFLSWVVVSHFVFAFLSVERGMFNRILEAFGQDPVFWYNEPKFWPFFIVGISQWKGVGFNSIIYLAAIVGIDKNYYEAALIDGASKWQQIKHVTIPMLKPLMIILTLLSIGNIFSADFGLFYQIPRDSGPLYPVTNVIDTYVYRGLMSMGDIGMSTAAGLYQATVGFVLIMITNYIVRKIDEENALF